jgi:hypothetical protein
MDDLRMPLSDPSATNKNELKHETSFYGPNLQPFEPFELIEPFELKTLPFLTFAP